MRQLRNPTFDGDLAIAGSLLFLAGDFGLIKPAACCCVLALASASPHIGYQSVAGDHRTPWAT
ncbi:hypothetical protein CGQ24_13935 [Arthrobacter sp. 7749]|nr:hypothetical protein CGQ24_13935 [Arthrobacter sp. 7749]